MVNSTDTTYIVYSLSMPRETRPPSTTVFRNTVWDHYHRNGRSLPWRKTRVAYRIFLSEIMLQQTQVSRVTKKYREFLKVFPSFTALANASQADVLRAWQGLGYNRRALNLHRAAAVIGERHNGRVPCDRDALLELPGIGAATAGSLQAFIHNIPSAFIETNIRSVFLHFFFPERGAVSDREILPLVEKTVDRENPREWYYALMDYGVFLKGSGNPNIRSAHYSRQSPFKGSNREVRSAILAYVLKHGHVEKKNLYALRFPADRVDRNVSALEREGFIRQTEEAICPVS